MQRETEVAALSRTLALCEAEVCRSQRSLAQAASEKAFLFEKCSRPWHRENWSSYTSVPTVPIHRHALTSWVSSTANLRPTRFHLRRARNTTIFPSFAALLRPIERLHPTFWGSSRKARRSRRSYAKQ